MKRITSHVLPCLTLIALLSACGGGGGADTGTTAPAASPAAAPTTVGEVQPAASMDWRTAEVSSLNIALRNPDTGPAAGAALRVFSATRRSPIDGSTLEEPIPLTLLETMLSDAGGNAQLSLRLASHVDEVLVVATAGDLQAQQSFKPGSAAQALTLQLAR